MNINENKYYIMSGDPAFDNFSPSGFHLECDFEHNYYWVPNTDFTKPCIIPRAVKLNGVIYDLVPSEILKNKFEEENMQKEKSSLEIAIENGSVG